jgi:predicted kinase
MAIRRKPPLQFHLMIGAACSGKSTTARILARALQAREECVIRYISSAGIRRELYGDSAIYGRWAEVEAEIRSQLLQAIAAEETVILEASYTRRAFRLAITQALELPVAVQWIGWWLDTPLQLCLQWNQRRSVPLPPAVIEKHCAQLLQSAPVPHRQEGFALVVRLRPDQGIPLERVVPAELERLEGALQRATNRDGAYQLHGYSRLLDLERLLYLIRLLSDHPKLSGTGEDAGKELEHLLSPLPAGGVAERAAALLARLHGACYGDALAVSGDLAWLDQQGYTARWLAMAEESLPLIEPPPWPLEQRPAGGLPRLADRAAFQQVFTLLRHLLRHPHAIGEQERVSAHLARSLNASSAAAGSAAPGAVAGVPWSARQVQVAINDTLTPYGFRLPGRSGRRGYSLGTALLSLPELREVAQLLQLQAEHLGDSQARRIGGVLRERLAAVDARTGSRADLVEEAAPRRRWIQPTRPLPSLPSLPDAAGRRAGCSQAVLIETAIAQRQRLLLSLAQGSPLRGTERRSGAPQSQAVWPLQLLLHSGSWWLLVEHDAIGQPDGLLRCLPLGGLHVYQAERGPGRELHRHQQALERARILERCCGGLCFGEQLAGQQALCEQTLVQQGSDGGGGSNASAARDWLVSLRLSCSAAVLPALRRDLDRFPPAAVRLAAALPGDSWGRPQQGSAGLTASTDSRLPYPVEVDLPAWVVSGDGELRRWLYSYGAALRINAPAELAAEHRQWLCDALGVYRPVTPVGAMRKPARRRERKRFSAAAAAAAWRRRQPQRAAGALQKTVTAPCSP